MSRAFPWKKRVFGSLLLIVLISFGAAILFTPGRRPIARPEVAILDPRLTILWAQMREGTNTYYLPKDVYVCQGRLGNSLEGKLRGTIWNLGVHVDTLSAFRPGNGTNGRAFFVGYAFPNPPTSSVHLVAEVVGDNGTSYPLRSAAGGGGGPPERSWNLWILDSMPLAVTNYFLRLSAETNATPVAEIKFGS